MMHFLILGFLIATIVSACRREWRQTIHFGCMFVLFLSLGIYALLSWNALMLRVNGSTTTHAAP